MFRDYMLYQIPDTPASKREQYSVDNINKVKDEQDTDNDTDEDDQNLATNVKGHFHSNPNIFHQLHKTRHRKRSSLHLSFSSEREGPIHDLESKIRSSSHSEFSETDPVVPLWMEGWMEPFAGGSLKRSSGSSQKTPPLLKTKSLSETQFRASFHNLSASEKGQNKSKVKGKSYFRALSLAPIIIPKILSKISHSHSDRKMSEEEETSKSHVDVSS